MRGKDLIDEDGHHLKKSKERNDLMSFLQRLTGSGPNLMSLGPSIGFMGEKLIAKTSFLSTLISLALFHRTVIVDPVRKLVTVRTRIVWFHKRTRIIPFQQIKKITYRYEDMNPITAWGESGETKDRFSVGLRLKGREDVHFFHFSGDGGYHYGDLDYTPEWVSRGVQTFDRWGGQEQDSRAFVSQLQRLLQVKVIN